MSDIPASTSFGWAISARRDGDVLAARARGEGIELLLLSRSAGHDPGQIEGWLAELIGVAVETSRNDPGDRPISALLRHALTGLLFSHAELWHHTPQDPPCSVAFVTTNDRVAFGWAGPAQVGLWVDERPADGPWIRVRDPDGREAQAMEVEIWRRVRLHLVWTANDESGSPAAVEVSAEWPGRAAERSEPARSAEPAATVPEWRVPNWLRQRAPWEGAPEEQASLPEAPAPEPTAVEPPVMSVPMAAPPLPPAAPAPAPVAAPPPPPATSAAPTPAAPSEPASVPLEIIRGMGSGPPAPPPADMEIVRTPEPIAPEEAVSPPLSITHESVAISPIAPQQSAPPPPPPVRPSQESIPSPAPEQPEPVRTLQEPTPSQAPEQPEPVRPPPHLIPSPALERQEPVRTFEEPTASPVPERLETVSAAEVASETSPALTSWSMRTAPTHPSRPRSVRRPAWPSESEPSRPWWRHPGRVAAVMLALFAVGWLLGTVPGGHRKDGAGGPFSRLLARFGLGPAHYQVVVDSHPQGAWIALDGRDLARRTPATLDVTPGPHRITLSVANLGSVSEEVIGERNSRASIDAKLWGSLAVTSMDNSVAVRVSVDGTRRGLAPVTVDSLAPGVHQVQFWSPGAGSWDQIVEVRVRQTSELIARPFASPATGLLEVRATVSEEGAPQPVSGATVWLDGEMRGATPYRIELPRGPHSVRVAYRGQDSPVQVIDLPGGNQRFAHFDLTADLERPRLVSPAPGRLTSERPTLVSATLEGLGPTDVREMWLHVSTPEGSWQRYAMNVLKAPGGAVGAVVFPISQLDRRGRARYYVSVSTRSGDELFTELQAVQGPPAASAASTR